jgi:transcription elongation factor SPT6
MVVGRIVEDHARAIPEEVNTIAVHFLDDTVPSLAGGCAAMRAELSEHSAEVRHAVALGRYLRNPPAVVAALAAGGEALALPLSPLQATLSDEEKVAVVERGLLDVVNQIGVDINAAVAHPWQTHQLGYVAGLGRRKAATLVAAIRASDGGVLESRSELVGDLDAMGPCVYRNAASFLRVVDDYILDATRIHPDNYAHVLELLANALDYDYEQLKVATSSVQRKTLEKGMDPDNWEKLAVLDLRAYADYLASARNEGWLLQTLRDVRMELHAPSGEIRTPWSQPSPWEEFSLLTGETTHSLCPGKIVQVTVKKLVPPRDDRGGHVLVQLESGVTGMISKEDLSDRPVDRLEHKVAVGQVIAARVKANGLELEHSMVHLACKGSLLSLEESSRWEAQLWGHKRFYSMTPLEGEKAKPARKPKKSAARPAFISRNIDHPLFQNVTAMQAQEYLKTRDIGEVLLRPSSKGVTHLSLTVKFYDDMYVHYDIKEGAKPGVGHTANLALGSPLTVDGAEYDDLDEVYARHVEPMVGHLKEMIRHRKFRRGTKRDVDQRLKVRGGRVDLSID